MIILLTGSTGFIGRALMRQMENKHRIFALGGDLSSSRGLGGIIRSCKGREVDAIIHLASVVCTPQNRIQIKLLEDNRAITNAVIAIAQAVKPKIFIHASSMAVYPNRDGLYKENGVIDPSGNGDGIYGLAKFDAEVLLNFFLGVRMKVMHLRFTQVYGSGMRADRIFPSMIRELLEKNTITVLGGGERVTNFIHINDVVATIVQVLKRPCPGVYNVGCRAHRSLKQWAAAIIGQYGNRGSRLVIVAKGSRVKQRIDTRLLEKTFGLKNFTVDLEGIMP